LFVRPVILQIGNQREQPPRNPIRRDNMNVVIERIDPKYHHGQRYQITANSEYGINRNWSLTLWGAHRAAKKMRADLDRYDEITKVVEVYDL
jgi:hypothetical protein